MASVLHTVRSVQLSQSFCLQPLFAFIRSPLRRSLAEANPFAVGLWKTMFAKPGS